MSQGLKTTATLASVIKETDFYLPWVTGETAHEIETEITRAKFKHGDKPFNSKHEGYAVLLEEVRELEEAVFKDHPKENIRTEAIQVAAMAIRIINELTK